MQTNPPKNDFGSSSFLLISSEHAGTSNDSRTPGDIQNALLQLTVSTGDADPHQHHHVREVISTLLLAEFVLFELFDSLTTFLLEVNI